MRYILIILVFLSVGANAQMVIKAHANYRPLVQPAANLLLDDYPNAAAAYSLRKLDKDYTGNCIRVRKDTTGQPEQEIGFLNNYLDTNALKAFVGNNESRIVTWYDQSGNGRNATQSTAANQPYITVTGGQITTINAVASNINKAPVFNTGIRLINNFSTILQPITVFSYARIDNATTGAAGVLYDSYNNTASPFYYTGLTESPNNTWRLSAGTGLSGTAAGNINPNLFSTLHNGASSSIRINGQSYASGNAGTNGLAGLSMGNIRGNPSPIVGGYVLGGRIGELIIYGSDQSSNRTGIENNINDYYNIYWNGDFTGILDTYPNSAAAYSLRNLSSTYKGPLIRVRKDTTGQPEMDIYGDYYGNLDTVGLKNFLQTRSGFVTTWYDQSGQGRNGIQSTVARQARIALNGVIDRVSGKPSLFFNENNFTLNGGDTILRNRSIVYLFANVQSNVTAQGNRFVYNSTTNVGNTRFGLVCNLVSNRYTTAARRLDSEGSATLATFGSNHDNSNRLLTSYSNYASGQIGIYMNGSTLVTNTLPTSGNTSNTNGASFIGAAGSTVQYFSGNISEIVIYLSDQSSNRTGIESNINTYYGIY